MAKVVFFVSCLAVFYLSSVSALECYHCPLGCSKDAKPDSGKCGETQSKDIQAACLKQVTKGANNEEIVSKKCVIYPAKKSEYECITAPGQRLVSCNTCQENLCNGAENINIGYLGLMTAVSTLFVSKYLIQ